MIVAGYYLTAFLRCAGFCRKAVCLFSDGDRSGYRAWNHRYRQTALGYGAGRRGYDDPSADMRHGCSAPCAGLAELLAAEPDGYGKRLS